MFNILERYIGRVIFNSTMMTMIILISLSGIIKFVEQLRTVGQGSYSTLGAGFFTLLNIPKDIEIFFPMAVLLGALLGLGSLATYGELVVMQASGFSRMRIAASVMKTIIPMVFSTMAIGEWIVPEAKQIASNYRNHMIYGSSILSTLNRLWVKDGQDFIFIERVVNNNELTGVNIYHLNKEDRLQSLCYAARATYINGNWKLLQVNESDLTDDKQIIGKNSLNSEWKTNFKLDKRKIIVLEPNSLSILELYNHINYLKQSGQESDRYQLIMWSKIFSPFLVAAMMLMALSFIFGPLRSLSTERRVITGISFGFLFYILDQIFKPLSLVYSVPPMFGAMLPIFVFLMISIFTLLQHQ